MTRTFSFGDNWLKFAADLTDEQVAAAQKSLQRLLSRTDLSGLRFLDIGCGSGLSSLAARRLGAHVHSFDFDPNSVSCTRALRDRFRPGDDDWIVDQGSILDDSYIGRLGTFDIVYSWGVLHHTGAMWTALARAASLVAPDGVLAVAIYRKTPLCAAWRIEKRLYAAAPAAAQTVVRGLYQAAQFAALALAGRNPVAYVRGYKSARGMNWRRDVHDWLGGYPYESAKAIEVKARLGQHGVNVVRSFERPAGIGLFGSGCDEFVCQRPPLS